MLKNSKKTSIKILIFIVLLIEFTPVLSFPTGWKLVDVRYDKPDGYTDSKYIEIKCADSSNCMIWNNLYGAGGYYIRRTTDGGNSWKNVYLDSAYSYMYGDSKFVPNLRDIAYPNEKLFIAVGDSGLVIRTTDKGETWIRQCIGKNITLKNIRMLDENYGIVQCGYFPRPIMKIDLLETTDGGTTWNIVDLPIIDKIGFNDIQVISRNLFGAIIRYLDPVPKMNLLWVHGSGKSWDTLAIPNNNYYMDFINENEGWISGGYLNSSDYSQTTQSIYHTADGGKSWVKQRDLRFNGDLLSDIRFFDNKFGITSSCLSLLLLTTDGGNTWSENTLQHLDSLSGKGYCLSSPQVPSATTAFIISDGDSVFKYTREISDTTSSDIPETKTNINLYPNPVNDYITIPKDDKLPKVKIYTLEGILLADFDYNEKIDVSALVPGFYILRLGNKYQKFIKL